MSSATAQPDPTPNADPWIVRGEEQLAFLREVTEITMAVLRVAGRRAIEVMEAPSAAETGAASETAAATPAKPESPRQDPVERIAKLSRIVRLTITLEAKLAESLKAYIAGEVVKTEARRAEAEKDSYAPLKAGKKARARQLLRDVIDREIPDPEDHDILYDALDERLLIDDAYDHIDDLPLRDIVEHLCADLQLKPDWKRWTGEGWEPNPPFFRPLCSPFFTSGRRPILEHSPGSVPDPWD